MNDHFNVYFIHCQSMFVELEQIDYFKNALKDSSVELTFEWDIRHKIILFKLWQYKQYDISYV